MMIKVRVYLSLGQKVLSTGTLREDWMSRAIAHFSWKRALRSEKGALFLETAVAVVLLGIVGTAFLSALATSSTSRVTADEHATGRILAESQMEDIKKQSYSLSYDPVPIPDEYPGYFAVVDTESLRNGQIQKITITIRHHNKDVTQLESYKVNR
jgi:Tfp pilus assembly protein PilV